MNNTPPQLGVIVNECDWCPAAIDVEGLGELNASVASTPDHDPIGVAA
jgi:hypothetical protein